MRVENYFLIILNLNKFSAIKESRTWQSARWARNSPPTKSLVEPGNSNTCRWQLDKSQKYPRKSSKNWSSESPVTLVYLPQLLANLPPKVVFKLQTSTEALSPLLLLSETGWLFIFRRQMLNMFILFIHDIKSGSFWSRLFRGSTSPVHSLSGSNQVGEGVPNHLQVLRQVRFNTHTDPYRSFRMLFVNSAKKKLINWQ